MVAVTAKELHPHKSEGIASGVSFTSILWEDLSQCHIRLKMDNKSAVAYVNKLGGTRSLPLNSLALEMWDWCLQRGIWISAEYLPGQENL